MSKSKREFIWGETPVIMVGSLHHFLNCPVYFNEVEAKEGRGLYTNVNLPMEQRIPRLKRYQTLDAIYRGMWRDHNIVYILGQIFNQANTHIYLVDGYTSRYLDILMNRVESIYKHITGIEAGISLTNHFTLRSVATAKEYYNTLSEAEADVRDKEWAYVKLDIDTVFKTIPEIPLHDVAVEAARGIAPGTTQSGDPAEVMTEEEIDNLLHVPETVPKSDDNGGGEGVH